MSGTINLKVDEWPKPERLEQNVLLVELDRVPHLLLSYATHGEMLKSYLKDNKIKFYRDDRFSSKPPQPQGDGYSCFGAGYIQIIDNNGKFLVSLRGSSHMYKDLGTITAEQGKDIIEAHKRNNVLLPPYNVTVGNNHDPIFNAIDDIDVESHIETLLNGETDQMRVRKRLTDDLLFRHADGIVEWEDIHNTLPSCNGLEPSSVYNDAMVQKHIRVYKLCLEVGKKQKV